MTANQTGIHVGAPILRLSTSNIFLNDSHYVNDTISTEAETALTTSVIIYIIFLGVIGCAGVLMNIGVLVVVHFGNLIKKDYRMVYYLFITIGDLMFATHSVFLVFSILYRDSRFFRNFIVCFNIQVVFGVVAYQWTAVCIILLIVDLTWTLKFPFTGDDRKRIFSKVSCSLTFLFGILLATLPFQKMLTKWTEELSFCSIANIYGTDWTRYQLVATVILSFLLCMLVICSCYLLYTIYRQHIYKSSANRHVTTGANGALPRVTSSHPAPKNRMKPSHDDNDTIAVDVETNGTENSVFEPDEDVVSTKPTKEEEANNIETIGVSNPVFEPDEDVCTKSTKEDEITRTDVHHSNDREHRSHLTAMETKRRHFIGACRTVASFMAVYVGCCGPYYVWMAQGIGCTSKCDKDTNDDRFVRVVVAFFLYLLPVIDPILYTQRFDLFKRSAYNLLRSFSLCNSS